MYLRTYGIVLSRKNYGEADRILRIYTKDLGKVSALAKGVRRPRSRKGGHVEIGNLCKFFIAKGRNLDLVTEVELKKAFGIDKFTEDKANKIYHLLELVDLLTEEKQKNPEVFNLLFSFLKKIEKKDNFSLISSVFKVRLLKNLGFFSASSFKNSKMQSAFQILEDEDFETIEIRINGGKNGYLKLLNFLDSMIENIAQAKLRTNRFL